MAEERDWKADVREAVTTFGHRNWIVVADSAFPLLVSAGVREIVTRRDQLTVTKFVADALTSAPHILPHVWFDAELAAMTDAAAPGVEALRETLHASFPQAKSVLHEELIAKVNAAGEAFSVLMLKTDSILPYTTVFFELDCGYWDAERETALRTRLAAGA